MKGLGIIVLIVLAFVGFYFLFLTIGDVSQADNENTATTESDGGLTIFSEVRAELLVGNTPRNNALLDAVPPEVSLTFAFRLHESSRISITRNEAVISDDEQHITQDGLTMFTDMADVSGSGPYLVTYSACADVDVCTSGRFGFSVR